MSLNQNRRSFNQSLDGMILQPAKINEQPNPLIVEPEVLFTKSTTESILGVLLPQLGNK